GGSQDGGDDEAAGGDPEENVTVRGADLLPVTGKRRREVLELETATRHGLPGRPPPGRGRIANPSLRVLDLRRLGPTHELARFHGRGRDERIARRGPVVGERRREPDHQAKDSRDRCPAERWAARPPATEREDRRRQEVEYGVRSDRRRVAECHAGAEQPART